MRNTLTRLLTMFALMLPAWAGPVLNIVDLGTLGGSMMAGTAINSKGEVVGYGAAIYGNLQPFSSTAGIFTGSGFDSATANGINGNGQVVGTVHGSGNSQATLWVNGAAQQLGGLGGADSFGNAINNLGQMVGMATTPEGTGRAVYYSGGSVLDISPSGSQWSSAYAINNNGVAAGYAMDAGMNFRAFTWAGSASTQLGTLGGSSSYAFGVNDGGQVAGHSATASGYLHAFVWNSAGGFADLGTLGGTQSFGYAINNAGAVVGSSNTASGEQHAFMTVNGAIVDLNSLAKSLGGWTLTTAYAINDAGQITGSGLLDGVEHAFRLDPLSTVSGIETPLAAPEPSTLALITMALGAIASYRLRNTR